MILVLDIGNTNITIGCYEGKKLKFVSRMASDISRMEDQYAIELLSILSIYGVEPKCLTGCIISSVVPPLLRPIGHAAEKITGVHPLVVGPGIKTGLNIKIDSPSTLGADLVAGCVSALERYPCPCIVLDMGTASTFTVLDENRSMIGGCIIPGVRVSMEALCLKTAQLPQIGLAAPQRVIGNNTVDCMNSGCVFGTAAMVDGMCERIEQELGKSCTVVATGDFAEIIIPYCKRKIELEENLLLDGLRILYEKNQVV